MGRAEDLPLGLDAPFLHHCRQLLAAGWRGIHQHLATFKRGDYGGRIERAHLGSCLHALDSLLPHQFGVTVWSLLYDVTVDAAASRVVDDDVALRTHQIVNTPIDCRIACRLIVGSARVNGNDAGASVKAAIDIIGDLVRLSRKIWVHFLVRHATRWRDRDDHFSLCHFAPLSICDVTHGYPQPARLFRSFDGFGVNQDEGDLAGLFGSISPGMIGAALNKHVAGYHLLLANIHDRPNLA